MCVLYISPICHDTPLYIKIAAKEKERQEIKKMMMRIKTDKLHHCAKITNSNASVCMFLGVPHLPPTNFW